MNAIRPHLSEEQISDLVRDHQPLMRKVARTKARVLPPGWELADVEQQAWIFVFKQLRRFDPRRGASVQGWTHQVIQWGVSYVLEHAWGVPQDALSKANRMRRAWTELTAELGRSPMPSEVADRAGVRTWDVQQWERLQYDQAPLSFEEPLGDDDTLHDRIGADGPDTFDLVANHRALEQVEVALQAMPAQARGVVQGTLQGRGLAELARDYGVSRQRVSQINKGALAELSRLMATSPPSPVPCDGDGPHLGHIKGGDRPEPAPPAAPVLGPLEIDTLSESASSAPQEPASTLDPALADRQAPKEIPMPVQPATPRQCEVPGCGKPHKGHRRCDAHLAKARRGGWVGEDPKDDDKRHREFLAGRASSLPGTAPAAASPEPASEPPAPRQEETPGHPAPVLTLSGVIDLLTLCGATIRPRLVGGSVVVEAEGEPIHPQRLLQALLLRAGAA